MFVHVDINYFAVDVTMLFSAYSIYQFELAVDYTNYAKL